MLRDQLEKVRKGQFAKINEVKKENSNLKHEMEILKAAICQYNSAATPNML